MNRESHYLINVTRNLNCELPKVAPKWEHFFRVESVFSSDARRIYRELTVRFPECKVEVSYWDCSGTTVEFDLFGAV